MNNTIEITKDSAVKAYENASAKGKKLLEDLLGKKHFQKSILERIKNFDDVLTELEISKTDFEFASKGLTKDEIAYREVKLIAEALNEGWQPDWTNSSEAKYYPWFTMGSPSGVGFSYDGCGHWRSHSGVGSRLCYRSKELAEYAGKQFLSIYKELFTL